MKITVSIFLFIALILGCSKPTPTPNYYESLENCKSWKSTDTFDPTKERILYYDCLDGSIIPNFTYTNMAGIKDQIHNKKEYTLLNLWFIGCQPCIEEIPDLVLIHNEKNIDVIAIALDNENDLMEFLKTKSELNYEVVPNGKSIIRDTLKIPFGYPINYLISPDNKIVSLYAKMTPDIVNEIIQIVSE